MKRKHSHIDNLSSLLDNKDSSGVMGFLTDDCLFQAGNNEVIQGKSTIKASMDTFFDAIKTTNHHIEEIFESENTSVHRGKVTYTRLDDSQLTVPFCDVFKMEGTLISEYYIYIDWSELFK